MRIVLIDPGDFTPAYDEELARALHQLGHDVVLIGKHAGPRSTPYLRRPLFYAALANDWASALPASLVRGFKGAHHVLDMARLILLLRRMQPDVIHFQWMPLPLIDTAFVGALRRIAPFVLTVHDSEPYHGATNRLMVLGFTRLARAADSVVAHTRSTAERLERLGVDPELFHRVPHGILHPPAGSAAPNLANRRARADGALRLLQFGKIKAYKGGDVLIEALGRLEPEARRRIHVRIVGAPYIDVQPLLRRVRELGLSEVVEFRLGFVSDEEMMTCFAEADAMVFPYRQIDASGVLMAAVAHDLPVIASRIGDFAELLEDGREALLVQPGDPQALAAAIATLANSPERLMAMGSAMRRVHQTIPGWNEIAARTVAAYEHAQEQHAGRVIEARRAQGRAGVPTR
jgi:glycosyltransferase involved in cell wall biosynthesis